ncbi:MAG TPA: TrkA C-terminal domain-containing protein, partial [Ktedonobacteraceae bacterium]
ADRILSPYTIAGHRMANLALQPGVMEFFETITKAGDAELAVQEVVVPATSALAGKTLVEAQNTLSYGTMLVALKRPSGVMPGSRLEARIEVGDTIIVVGALEQLSSFKQKNHAQ